jgi:hypothetical protein
MEAGDMASRLPASPVMIATILPIAKATTTDRRTSRTALLLAALYTTALPAMSPIAVPTLALAVRHIPDPLSDVPGDLYTIRRSCHTESVLVVEQESDHYVAYEEMPSLQRDPIENAPAHRDSHNSAAWLGRLLVGKRWRACVISIVGASGALPGKRDPFGYSLQVTRRL